MHIFTADPEIGVQMLGAERRYLEEQETVPFEARREVKGQRNRAAPDHG